MKRQKFRLLGCLFLVVSFICVSGCTGREYYNKAITHVVQRIELAKTDIIIVRDAELQNIEMEMEQARSNAAIGISRVLGDMNLSQEQKEQVINGINNVREATILGLLHKKELTIAYYDGIQKANLDKAQAVLHQMKRVNESDLGTLNDGITAAEEITDASIAAFQERQAEKASEAASGGFLRRFTGDN